MNSASDSYLTRFRKVFDYIDTHLDEALNVERLSQVAAFSKYHFHRQFTALFGMGVYRYVQLLRMKRAAYQLAFRSDSQVTAVAAMR
jgi:AraC family transcriptional regulator